MRTIGKLFKAVGRGLRQGVTYFLEHPDVYEPIDFSKTVKALGFENEAEMRLALQHRRAADGVADRIKEAHEGIKWRMTQRDRSYNISLLLAGLLATAQVSIMLAGLAAGGYWRFATLFNDVGLLALVWGVLAILSGVFPTHKGDESVEAVSRHAIDWYEEDIRRSGAQRSQLWRLRVGLLVGLMLTVVTVVLIVRGVVA
jgi:hypothetical protein